MQSASNTNVLGTNQQNTLTTTSGGYAGTVAPVPVSTALAPPGNIGVSSSDVLAEQVQINSQIVTLQLLLQGALSDQYLLKGSRAVATRQQTTVGFGVSLNPPQRYKHAVAEVRVWIEAPPNASDRVGVVNLLPADKTYNVAKVTSHQNAFGAGVVVEAVNLGVAGGKSKDRLYLAKDTDTVALQYHLDKPETPSGGDRIPRSAQESVRDTVRVGEIWQHLSDACDDPKEQMNSVVFGWQFRPVLGADYVQAGQRTVYAQLALPVGVGEQFAPKVHIQTRWREYDSSRQVLGAVYKGSCSISDDPNPITVISPLRVHNASVEDMGSGVLKVSADGDFFSNGLSVLSGGNAVIPTTFDGSGVQFFAKAADLPTTDDLKLIGEDRRPVSLGMPSLPGGACGISSATLSALPHPDGNATAELTVTTGTTFTRDDGPPHPLVLIGSQVYGLHETPFAADAEACADNRGGGRVCTYRFLASTEVLRSAQTFTVRDLAWRDFKKVGTIELDPIFSSLAILGAKPETSSPPPLYTLSGFRFDKFQNASQWCAAAVTARCVEIYQGMNKLALSPSVFDVESKTIAAVKLDPPATDYSYKFLRLIWHATGTEKVEWDLPIPADPKPGITASAVLTVGDSQQLVFSNVEMFGVLPTATFDNALLAAGSYSYDGAKKTLTALITSAMTAKTGHKSITLTDSQLPPAPPGGPAPAMPKQVQLPFEVVKR